MEKRKVKKSKVTHLVGIGASAGGLEALEAFFEELPVDTNMAFVVVQHLAPDFKSMMDALLGRITTMKIHRVENKMRLEPNSIYLIPPRKEMALDGDRLTLVDRDMAEGLSLPIDIFFMSLAENWREKAIGIVLSGTGSDGSRGVRSIHEAGGLVLAQTPDSSAFDGMPKSAIFTGVVDATLTPNEMPSFLVGYSGHALSSEFRTLGSTDNVGEGLYSRLFEMLTEKFEIDFSHYKPSTINRRIERRSALRRVSSVNDYIDLVAEDSQELDDLYQDLLIGVTEFFRDPGAWETIEKRIIPELCKKVNDEKELRCWIPACATGEEALTLAILIHEHLAETGQQLNVRIFATDLNKRSLEFATAGIYPVSSLISMSRERIAKFFTRLDETTFQVIPEIRRMIVLAQQNLLKDPPFTRMDFVSCRNMLIYLDSETQQSVLSTLHFALRVDGILFLGSSETLGNLTAEFSIVDRRFNVFSKRRQLRLAAGAQNQPRLTAGKDMVIKEVEKRQLRGSVGTVGGRDINLIRAYDCLMEKFMPPSILIDDEGKVLHVFGDASALLLPPSGVMSVDIADIVISDLKMAVATAMQRVKNESATISYGGIRVTLANGEDRVIKLTIQPLSERRPEEYFLISFEWVELEPLRNLQIDETSIGAFDENAASGERVEVLERELVYTKEHLQATIEELETSNEELQATNEELMASNEELQSTNEELQSVNEELYTVNKEYEEKIDELTQLHDDMDNLLSSTEIGTIFLDEQLKIRKFTPAAAKQFNLLIQDIGRPIEHLTRKIDYDGFEENLKSVLEQGIDVEQEVRNSDGDWFLMRINPYRSEVQPVKGVVVTLVNIIHVKEAAETLERQNEDLQDFAYAVSHDLIEPLRLVSSYSELLSGELSDAANPKTKRYSENVKDSAGKMISMIDGLIDYSRVITRGKSFEYVDTTEAFAHARAAFSKELAEQNAVVNTGTLPRVFGEASQISNVFFRLLDNSIKFRAPERDLEISLSAEARDDSVIFTFSDNGIGFDKKEQDRIFSMFVRLHTAEEIPGYGVGLAIARRIISRHNGSFWSVPNTDFGATFCFTIPRKPPDEMTKIHGKVAQSSEALH